MKIAILSDTHDHIPNLNSSVGVCNRQKVETLIHCGDLISPFMLPVLAGFQGEVHLIYGNNVGDQHLISQQCGTSFPTINHHGIMGTINTGGRRFVFTHYPELAEGLAVQGKYDVVCCGHNHTFSVKQRGETLLINPGELLGKDEQPGFCILDSSTMQVERIKVGSRLLWV